MVLKYNGFQPLLWAGWRRRALAGRTAVAYAAWEQLNDIGKPVQPLPFTQTFDLNKLDDELRCLNDFPPVGQLDH